MLLETVHGGGGGRSSPRVGGLVGWLRAWALGEAVVEVKRGEGGIESTSLPHNSMGFPVQGAIESAGADAIVGKSQVF